MAQERAPDKYPIQFRLGTDLLAQVDRAVERSGISRNQWMTRAFRIYLRMRRPREVLVSAEKMLAHKVTLMARVEGDLIDEINTRCDEKDIPRTIWLLDACLNMLARKRAALHKRSR